MTILQEMIIGDSKLVFLVVFIFGFLTSLNPHMLGMVPMYMGHIVSSDKGHNKFRPLVIFSLSFSATLTLLGIVVSVIGASFHSIMKISYILAGLIYIFLGIKMLGLHRLFKLPIQVIIFYSNNKKKGGSTLRNILMPLIFTPCSLPFIISILTLAMVKGDPIYGGLVLLIFGLGHSLIFLLFGLISKYILRIKGIKSISTILHKVFGLLMILLGIFYLVNNSTMHM